MLIALVLAAAATEIKPGVPVLCVAPWHYDGDDVHCANAPWRALAHNHGMRVHAIDAPELNCAWRRGKPCSTEGGLAARDYLRALTAGRTVICTWTGDRTSRHTGSRPVVECQIEGVGDLGCAMMASGHAIYEPHFDPGGAWHARCMDRHQAGR